MFQMMLEYQYSMLTEDEKAQNSYAAQKATLQQYEMNQVCR